MDAPVSESSAARLRLVELGSCPAEQQGAKGAWLLRLERAGLPVPATRSVSMAALGAWAGRPVVHGPGIEDFWRACPTWTAATSERRPDIADLPADGLWAVRSSASCEDGVTASFAGRFHSERVVAAAIPAALARVAASLWSDQALMAMQAAEVDPRRCGMAALLQTWIAGRLSGVLMTRDPTGDDPAWAALSVVAGDCRACVDGSGAARVLRIARDGDAVATVAAAAGAPELPDPVRQELMALAGRAEEVGGCPLDIEWTWDGTRLWLLQARPLTGWRDLAWEPAPDSPLLQGGIWRRDGNAPFTPLAQDANRYQRRGRRRGALEAAMRWDCVAELVVEQGWMYSRQIPIDEHERQRRRKAWEERLREAAGLGLSQYDDVAVPLLAGFEERLGLLAARGQEPEALAERLALGQAYAEESSRLHWVALGGSGLGDAFRRRCRDLDPALVDWEIDRLLASEGWFSRESALLRRIAVCVASHPELRGEFTASPHDRLVHARCQGHRAFAQLAPLLDEYRHRFGILSGGNYSFGPRLAPTVGEEPWQLLARIRPLLDLDAAVLHDQRRRDREAAAELRRRLLEGLDEQHRAVFLRELASARSDAAMRNDHSFLMDQRYRGHLRLAMVDAGRWLVGKGLLAEPADGEFCHADELRAGLLDRRDLRGLAAERRTAHRRQRRLRAPIQIGGDRRTAAEPSCRPGAGPWRGRGGGPGEGEGPLVWGVPERLEVPALLAIPGRTGDYTHLLDRVLGVLCEVGNPFDHTGVIAREYGIPIVYQLGSQLRDLPVGACLHIDGATGVVRRAER